MAKTYVCGLCKGDFEFVPGQDEKAHAEAKELFGADGRDPRMAIVCDDCYQRMMAIDPPTVRDRVCTIPAPAPYACDKPAGHRGPCGQDRPGRKGLIW